MWAVRPGAVFRAASGSQPRLGPLVEAGTGSAVADQVHVHLVEDPAVGPVLACHAEAGRHRPCDHTFRIGSLTAGQVVTLGLGSSSGRHGRAGTGSGISSVLIQRAYALPARSVLRAGSAAAPYRREHERCAPDVSPPPRTAPPRHFSSDADPLGRPAPIATAQFAAHPPPPAAAEHTVASQPTRLGRSTGAASWIRPARGMRP